MSKAGENTGRKKRKPGGRPFRPGEMPPTGIPWKAGDPSPNPGGRPKSEPGFRERCRLTAERLRDRLEGLDFTYTTGEGGGGTDVSGLVRAFEAMADRGGYVSTDKLASEDTARARLVLAALALQSLTADQRNKLIAKFLGDVQPAERAQLTPGDPVE